MRNYVALNLARVWYKDNQGNVFGKIVWGTDLANLQDNLAWLTSQLSTGPTVELEDEGIQYVLLDKRNLGELLTVMASGFVFSFIGSHPYFYPKDPPTDNPGPLPSKNSPRKGWTDSGNVERRPPPSETGPSKTSQIPNQLQFDLVQQLGFLASQLIAAGQPALAQMVANVILKILQGNPPTQTELNKLFDAIEAVLA